MTDITHPQLVTALVKPPRAIIESLSDYTADLWHGATGVAGEAGELLERIVLIVQRNTLVDEDRENVQEELGDLFFYIEQLVQRTGIELDWDTADCFARLMIISPDMALEYAAQVAVYGSQVLDLCKKASVYNKEVPLQEFHTAMHECIKYALTIGYMFGVSREQALAANITKLHKRYEGLKYTDKAAQLRADKPLERKFFGQEREVGAAVKVPVGTSRIAPDE